MKGGNPRITLKTLMIFGKRLLRPADFFKHIAHGEMKLIVVRVEAHRLAVFGKRLCRSALKFECEAQLIMRAGIIFCDRERMAKQRLAVMPIRKLPLGQHQTHDGNNYCNRRQNGLRPPEPSA